MSFGVYVISGRRLAAFGSGLFSLWVAARSPLASMDHFLLTAHMAQHLLLMTVAAPLFLLGAPAIKLPQRLNRLRALGRLVTHQVFCWLAATATVIGWHVPVFFELGMRSARWHAFEQASFFVAGVLFWLPLMTAPRWSVPMYLFLATLPCDALSAFLTFCG